ncbi:MAG: dockerin type I domain-containing protein [Saprospiraceae bacterium]
MNYRYLSVGTCFYLCTMIASIMQGQSTRVKSDTCFISGIVETENKRPIKNVEVILTIPGQVFPAITTTEDGKYSFSIECSDLSATIRLSRNDFYKNGVSTLDLLRMQKHLLGIDLFNSPFKLVAADANNSQNVSALDMVELRKLILGIYTELPSNKSWRFVSKDPGSFNGESTFYILNTSHSNVDFIGVKIGDVNNTAKPD